MMASHESLARLRTEFVARGWFRKATKRILLELSVKIFLALAGIVVFVIADNLLIRIGALLVSTAGSIGVGTNSHTSSHYATSDKRWVNELLTYFGFSFFLGFSATCWRYKHITLHHQAPKVIGVDNDVNLWPWFAITEEEVGRSRGLHRLYYERLQWLVFPVLLAANCFNMQAGGWSYLIGKLRNHKVRNRSHWIDLGALSLHLMTNLLIPMFYFKVSYVLMLYIIRFGLLGYAMFIVLAPGHFPAEAVCMSKNQTISDHLLLQTAASVNFRTGLIGHLFCSGLENQIEHHLFPNVSHVYYRKMNRAVEKFCQEHGLPYRSFSWKSALWKSFMVFRKPQRIEYDPEGWRLRRESSGSKLKLKATHGRG